MPLTNSLRLEINNQSVDLGNIDDLEVSIDYILEEPENFESKQGATAQVITLPATKNNDQIFNTFWKPDVENLYSSVIGGILTGTIASGGSSYAVGEPFTIDILGGTAATGVVDTVGFGGVVTSFTLTYGGAGFMVGSTYTTTALIGAGTGLTITVTAITATSSAGNSPREVMDAILYVNGTVPILKGKALLLEATKESYSISLFGNTGDWLIDMQSMTLWDCVSDRTHTYDVATVEKSWEGAGSGGYDSDEDHDFVYAPVRYRQPFQYTDPITGGTVGSDDRISIYGLRPSLSIYWMIIRAFRQLGYSVESQFLNTQYFRRLVMPWTWGDFFDVNNQITDGLSFKAAGQLYPTPGAMPSADRLYTGPSSDPLNTFWNDGGVSTTGYVFNRTEPGPLYFNYWLNNVLPPNGNDNFGLYSFDDTTGTSTYVFNPPAAFIPYLGSDLTLLFVMNVIWFTSKGAGADLSIYIEVTRTPLVGPPVVTTTLVDVLSTTGTSFVDKGSMVTPTPFEFPVTNVNVGDTLDFRIKYDLGSPGNTFAVISMGYLDTDPTPPGASQWQYNYSTGEWGFVVPPRDYQELYSNFYMKGMLIQLGTPVNFKYFDNFRNHLFLDLLRGLIDTFDLEVNTDPINKKVIIEPFASVTLPDFDQYGNYTGDISVDGYFSKTRILDYTTKMDLDTLPRMSLFSNTERQLDFGFKQDGSDGGQNIYSLRYKGIYLSKVDKARIQNRELNNGIVAGIPGASRYMLPNRFATGNKQKNNRFFSSTMHYKHTPWLHLVSATSPAPQLIAIFPENINDSSASAVTQAFTPKLAFYKGLQDPAGFGGWRWIGDPSSPYTDGGTPSAIGFGLPYMFAVNYNNTPLIVGAGDTDPILSYCDQLVYDMAGNPVIKAGLMRKFFLQRLAIMRNGQLYHANLRLNLNDISNFAHREAIKLENSMFALIGIEGYRPLRDESCGTTLWKIVSPEQTDLDNCFPSQDSIENQTAILARNDLKYAQLLLYITDIPRF